MGCCYPFVMPGLGFELHGDMCVFIEPQIPWTSPVNMPKKDVVQLHLDFTEKPLMSMLMKLTSYPCCQNA